MGANIITGYTGTRHITPALDASVFRSAFGLGEYILSDGNKCAGSMPSINQFEILGGLVSMQGHQIQVTQETLAVDTCANGYERIDLVCMRFTHDNLTMIDAAQLVVIKGTEVQSGNTPVEPTYNTGTIDSGATIVDMPLYRIDLDGSNVTYTQVANVLDNNMAMMKDLFIDIIADGAGAHNSIYRGKYLGDHVTADQFAEISAGRFRDMFIGDYWTINGVNYRIADFNYWLHYGDTECTTNHIVLVPDDKMYDAKMNDSNTTTGAYKGSKMYTTYLATAISTIESAFGAAHILSHKDLITNAVTNGYASAGGWETRKVDLMSEEMVYGTMEFKNLVNGTAIPYNYTINHSQLNLFRLDHSKICIRSHWWLRDVVSSYFASVDNVGYCDYGYASGSHGVRPAFAIIG